MKRGNSMTGDPSVIHMVCIKCGYVIPMDVDIAYGTTRSNDEQGVLIKIKEVLDLAQYCQAFFLHEKR